MELKEFRKLAKDAGRKIKTQTVSFSDLGRNSRRFYEIVPPFKSYFSSEDERKIYISSLSAEDSKLFLTHINEEVFDKSEKILAK